MERLVFQAAFGDELRTVEISEAHGATGALQLSVNKGHKGQFVKFAGKWGLYLTAKAEVELTAEDRAVLIEWVEYQEKF